MTTSARSPVSPAAFAAIVGYALRITVGGKRWLVLSGGLILSAVAFGCWPG